MAAVEALLRLPTDEVQSYPSILSEEDILIILSEIETILRKCLYAIRYNLAAPFTAFLHLLLQPITINNTINCERLAAALLTPIEEGRCIDLLANICSTLLTQEVKGKNGVVGITNHRFRNEINIENFFEFIQILCGLTSLKETLGALLMPCLFIFLQTAVDSEDDYRQVRACASVLITLIRGSKANKNRMSVECGRIGEILSKSNDIFFQMQCVEIMYRLYTHNRTVLSTSTVSDFFRKGVAELPNDINLLTSIQTLLDAYNAEYNVSKLLQFTALLIEVKNIEVCGHTSMYFSPLILVIMIPGCSGDNITIPYEHIRSVKLSKERKLGLRLHVIPGKLSNIMSIEEGNDTLMISLTQSTFTSIRASGVHEWISDRKRRVPIHRIQEQLIKTKTTTTTIVSEKSSRKSSVKRIENNDNKEEMNANLVKYNNNNNINNNNNNNKHEPLSPLRGGSKKKSAQSSKQTSKQSSPVKSQNKVSLPNTYGEERNNNNNNNKEKKEEGENDALQQLHTAASHKVLRMRQNCKEEIQTAVDFMQEALEQMKRLNAKDRDEFEASVREDLIEIRRAEAKVKERAAECVQNLNQELTEVQALGEIVKVEIDKVREGLKLLLQHSEKVEEISLVQLKSVVDAEMQGMEETLTRVMSATNPLSFLSNYISQKQDNNNSNSNNDNDNGGK